MKKLKLNYMKEALIIILCLLCLIGGVMIIDTYQKIKNVDDLEETIEETLDDQQMSFYLPYIKAMIYTESAGEGIDVMQASESKYGTVNSMQSQKESIEAGVSFFKKALMLAKAEKCDVWTAVQAYNFGLNYIPYVAQRGGKNTIELAERYSKDVLSSKDETGKSEKYRYWHLNALAYNGGYLYKNGGNFFYTLKVKQNMELIHFINQWRK